MIFKVLNRKSASNLTYSDDMFYDCLIISITDCFSVPVKFNTHNPHIKGILRVQFDDVDFGETNCITREDADKIVEWVMKNKEKANVIIVQCEAGISRSAGVCAALMKIINGDDSDIFDDPRFCPNMSCYRSIFESYYGV